MPLFRFGALLLLLAAPESWRAVAAEGPATLSEQDRWSLLHRRASAAFERGEYPRGIAVAEQALDLARNNFDADRAQSPPPSGSRTSPEWNRRLVVSLNDLGTLWLEAGDPAKASAFYLEAVAAADKAFGPSDDRAILCLSGLAKTRYASGDYAKSLEAYAQSAKRIESRSGKSSESLIPAYNNISMALERLGRHDEAAQALDKALRISAATYGFDDARTAAAFSNLGIALSQAGRKKEASRNLEKAAEAFVKSLGAQHPRTAQAWSDLADTYKTQQRYDEAEIALKKALAVWKKILGPSSAKAVSAERSLKALDSAIRILRGERGLSAVLNRLKPGAALLPTAGAAAGDWRKLNDEALVSYSKGQWKQALAAAERALPAARASGGRRSPEAAVVLNNLGTICRELGQSFRAETYLRESLAIREEALQPDDPDVAVSLNNLAELHYSQHRYAEAEKLLKRALAVKEKSLGRYHPEVAGILENLYLLYEAMNRPDDAATAVARALDIRSRR